MIEFALIVLSLLGTASILIWLALLFHPARPWDLLPVAEEIEPPAAPEQWPPVAILVPARNESQALPLTLPALLTQDYPGPFQVFVIDDRSTDGTREAALRIASDSRAAEKLQVLQGKPLPEGWVGKVWALEQGYQTALAATLVSAPSSQAAASPAPLPTRVVPAYFLLTDADILHAPGSLRRLVSESHASGLALNSRMARLRCESPAEKLLIPPFILFFNLLYPMRRVNRTEDSLAAAAGGCMLVSAEALKSTAGFGCIRGEVIDDLNLARRIKALDRPIRLALSREEVASLRAYASLSGVWSMVRRTAFTELRHSWLRLAGALVGLALVFLVPPFLLVLGGVLSLLAGLEVLPIPLLWTAALAFKGILAWWLMAELNRPAILFFQLRGAWRWTLPLAGLLYGGMTLDSARLHLLGKGSGWREQGEAST